MFYIHYLLYRLSFKTIYW